MRKLVALCVIFIGVVAGQIIAYEGCCWQGDFYLNVEGLYWSTTHSPIGVAVRANRNAVQPNGAVDMTYSFGEEYDGGVRARLGYETCDFFADVAYLYFRNIEKERVDRDGYASLRAAGSAPDSQEDNLNFVSSRAEFRYQNVDVRLGHYFCQQRCFTPFVYVNARWVKIDFENTKDALNDDDPQDAWQAKQGSRFNGGALGLGAGGHYSICGNLGLGGSANLMAMIGETRFSYTSITEARKYNPFWVDRYCWTNIVPAFEFKLGLDYSCCFKGLQMGLEVGYELDWYSNILFYYTGSDPFSAGSFRVPVDTPQSVGFAGPFFRVGVVY